MTSPCAACRMLHRRCNAKCMLAPYFPADEPGKFAAVHKVFGASNVIRMLQIVDEERRDDAVKGLVYEAYARLRDPVYGCTGAIFYLQKCVEDLEKQLREAREQVLQSREQIDQLMNFLMNKEMI
ncbi:LOB domain-containing protein 1-like isoform X2 [Dioscorea cayenensis subsp. rotundata]|uniref:LOB domain-containing protein 1-like isoform X2 n=1 Tax=Dioscorea cayennensis subsp. rotundata TaxID=55577 RepID=A0AB40ANG7_DIOCR|nr:LOB domain-containing protein 1-like isoform X2 [Dioscorea cayenensis subsp. rotundata]